MYTGNIDVPSISPNLSYDFVQQVNCLLRLRADHKKNNFLNNLMLAGLYCPSLSYCWIVSFALDYAWENFLLYHSEVYKYLYEASKIATLHFWLGDIPALQWAASYCWLVLLQHTWEHASWTHMTTTVSPSPWSSCSCQWCPTTVGRWWMISAQVLKGNNTFANF